MKIIYNVRLLILTVLVASLYFIACKKDSAEANGATQLLSFGPTGAQPGDTIRFFGNNLNKVTQIDFQNASVDNKHFVSQSATEIYVVVPIETEKGYVTLKSPTGDVKSITQFNIAVASTVSSITSTARPGDNITIKGNYLNWVTSVTFSDGKAATQFVSQSLNELVVKVPADAQTGTLVLAYGGTESNYMETKDTLHVTLPLATSLAPNPIKHRANLTIKGTDLDLAKKVYFTNVVTPVTTFVSQSATEIVLKVPDSTQNGKITLEAASGVKTICPADLQIILPAITAVSPTPVKHASNLTITGTNIDLVDKIYFTGSKDSITTFVSKTATQVVVKVPPGAQDGKVTVEVAGVQSVSPMDVKLVWPVVTDMQPNPVDPKSNLTITGTNLDLVTAVAIQNAKGPVKTFISQSPTQIVLQVPDSVTEGKLTLSVLNSTVTVQSNDILKINGAVPPPVIAFPFYKDAMIDNWNGWVGGGWGGTKDMANTNPVREGDKSIKINYTAGDWGSPLQLGGGSVNFGSYTTFKISVYGGPGTEGKSILVVFDKQSTGASMTIAEGKWTDFSIPISSITSASSVFEIWIKDNTGTAYTIYLDDIGLN